MLAFVSYETEFSPCGGIAAVLARLPQRVAEVTRTSVPVITPFHHRLPKTNSLQLDHVGTVGVPFAGRMISVTVLCKPGNAPHYFLSPDDPTIFAGAKHPYDVPGVDLVNDAMFFGAAVEKSLRIIAPGAPWTLLLQDWESATVALACAGHPSIPRLFLTLHNSYDTAAGSGYLKHIGFQPHACPGETVLQRAMCVCEWPVFTVSQQFARDIVEDPFQARVLAPHIAPQLASRLVGVDNGPFSNLAVPVDILAAAEAGDYRPLLTWKKRNREDFLAGLDRLVPSADQPVFGDLKLFLRDDRPLFVMCGRDDCRQKGYDVAVHAADLLLSSGERARFVFFPMPGDEGLEGLTFVKRLVEKFPRHVLAIPFRYAEGFLPALRGATCGIMPSLYEPFGMANEFYLNGTIGIGRATGGVTQQIVPVPTARSTTPAVQWRAERVHGTDTPPTGFLFHELDDLPSELEDWSAINAVEYQDSGLALDRIQDRVRFPLFLSMAHELQKALRDAIQLAADDDAYGRLLLAGIKHIQERFSWTSAAQGYLRYAGN